LLKIDHADVIVKYEEYRLKYIPGSLREKLGYTDGAMKDIKQALELKPDDDCATCMLRLIQIKRKPKA